MRVALVGVGVVGRHLGRSLLAAGHEVLLQDPDPAATEELVGRGAALVDTPRAAAAGAEFLVSALPTPAELEEAAFGEQGINAGARPGLVHVMSSTVGPECVRALAERSAAAEVAVLDAPISAGPMAEGRPQLTIWAGGPPLVYVRTRPLLDVLAPYVLYCGPVGNAQVVKLVNNMTTLALASILGETLCLGVKAGVPLETLRAGLTWGTAQNRLMDEHFTLSVYAGDWRPGYRVDLAEKDVRLTEQLAAQLGVPLQAAASLYEQFARLRERGWADRSVHSIVRLAEEASGVRLRGPGAAEDDEAHGRPSTD
jgi:3-hydroxyisobutyrate dehydrogenase-like beta-hydroxyacid dehydrogenase